jgi:tetratricopeptide (TPR) repeat protein
MTRKHVILLAVLVSLVALVGCRSAHVTSAILYIDQQMYQKSIDVLHEGLEYSPDEAEAFFYLGESHTKLAEEAVNDNEYLEAKRQYTTAYEYYMKTIELAPDLDEQVRTSLLYSYALRKNNATNELNSARDAEGDLQNAYFEAAEGQFRLAYASYPDSTSPIKNVARMKMIQSNGMESGEARDALLDESLVLLDQVLEENPEAYALQADKANVLSLLGRNDEASRIYDQLLVEHPDDTGLLLDIANLAQDEQEFERAADLFVRVAEIYTADDDVDNDEDLLSLRLQAAINYSDVSVLKYAKALSNYDEALDLEDIPSDNTLFQKLKLHFDYAESLKLAAGATDTASLPEAARQQYQLGVNTGIALTDSAFDNEFGFYYLAMCHLALGNNADFNRAMEQYNQLQQ